MSLLDPESRHLAAVARYALALMSVSVALTATLLSQPNGLKIFSPFES